MGLVPIIGLNSHPTKSVSTGARSRPSTIPAAELVVTQSLAK